MTEQSGLVVDANIFLRAVLGRRARSILEEHEESVLFYCPDCCVEEAQRNLSAIAERRGFELKGAFSILERVCEIIEPVELSAYAGFRELALERVSRRDADDWPVVAVALMLQLPIWTEDQDFFGIGIPTWTTDRVEVYLRQ